MEKKNYYFVKASKGNLGDTISFEKDDDNNIKQNNDMEKIKKDIQEIKELLISRHWNNNKNAYGNKNKENKETLIDLEEILELLRNNERLLKNVNIEIKICITKEESKKLKIDKKFNTSEIVNPIEVYRNKGEKELRKILLDCDIAMLREVAKQYTPDPRRYVYKWTDAEKIVDYIVKRSMSLSQKGNVFIMND